MFIKLVEEWNGYKKGETMHVGEYTAAQLIKQKLAKEEKEPKKK